MPSVIYIVGSGHSGSTVLDALLGSHPDIVGVGELSHFFRGEWMAEQYCACGATLTSCDFWTRVASRVRADVGVDRYDGLMSAVRSVERIRRIPALATRWYRERDAFRDYVLASTAVLRAISEVSGRTVIVDSSKNPARLFALSFVPGVDLKTIHLVRDGRAVAYSYRKSLLKQPESGIGRARASKAVWRSALTWRFTNVLSEHIGARIGCAGGLLRYEDFVGDVAGAFDALQAKIGIDLRPVVSALEAGSPIEFHHRLAGNPVRMSRGVRLKLDQEWQSALTEKEKVQFWGIAGPVARRYGYEKYSAP